MADCLQLRCSKDAAPPFGQEAREKLFSLRKDLVFANHGSFGTVPRSVLEAQRRLQDEIELEPDEWFKETSEKVWDLAADAVARFVNAQPENIALVANATTAANCVIKSLRLSENDSILIADHTYPAVCHTVEVLRESTRAKIISHIFPYPVQSEDQFCATFLSTLESDASIRLAVIDHITSQSAMVLPIRKLIGMCHERNVDVLIDGAHAPGHVPLDLEALGADYYTGNLHKWMYSPRGCAFLYARRDKQDCLRPPITSHYWKRDFRERFMEQGTRDFTPQCCALTAVQFYQWLGDLDSIPRYNCKLLDDATPMLASMWKTSEQELPASMKAPGMRLIEMPLPKGFKCDVTCAYDVMKDLAHNYGVRVLLPVWNERIWCRISCQVYCQSDDYVRLGKAVLKWYEANSKNDEA